MNSSHGPIPGPKLTKYAQSYVVFRKLIGVNPDAPLMYLGDG